MRGGQTVESFHLVSGSRAIFHASSSATFLPASGQ